MPATQLFTQSLTTDATAASVLESSIIESDKELMMPKRSVVSSDRAAKYHRLTHVSGDGYIDLQVCSLSNYVMLSRFNRDLHVALHHVFMYVVYTD